MAKKLNTDAITNELSGGSAFFPSYKGTDSPPPKREETTRPVEPQTSVQQPEPALPERSNVRTPERKTAKRIITRNSFEIYEDQMDSLRERSYKEKMAGKIGSMSAMVRKAIDNYLLEEPLDA